ncbi:hypothetical protein HK407_09g14950 [Ordospora pajunii]|uniref:uncharacterized protein n=1 Tax=Ordospora pajunii TaxID=3039483 RepID=UPI0029527648|nr:uncharacterized protein HK407_09g14950 [Ordospora pajunii]KAH9410900.1 hypothetical protein HK407_09g14950 [Ordospora pajunii]
MEEEIAQIVEKLLEQISYEMHGNKVYSIADKNGIGVNKQILRAKLLSGDRNATHTEVRIKVGVSERSNGLCNRSPLDHTEKGIMIFEYNNMFVEVSIDVENEPVYMYGEYIKMSRSMTQTPLHIGKALKCNRSVSDFCRQLQEFFCADNVKFVPAGREDMDVQMIEGRPFLLVVMNPKKSLMFRDLELALYKEVDIINLKVVRKECKDAIFSGEVSSKKTYSLFVCSKHPIDIQKHYDVEQMTPLRVMHRRANMTREKKIDILTWKSMEAKGLMYYQIVLEASAGAYIKEFVNGDFGRTRPSLGGSSYCDLLELDVIRVEKHDIEKFVERNVCLKVVRE